MFLRNLILLFISLYLVSGSVFSDGNEDPIVSGFSISIKEEPNKDTFLGTLKLGRAVNLSLTDNPDPDGDGNSAFSLRGTRILVNDSNDFDYELNENVQVLVKATDDDSIIAVALVSVDLLDDRGEDFDGDGLSEEAEEDRYGTSDLSNDSDDDGLSDSFEIGYGRFDIIKGTFSWNAADSDAKLQGGQLATFSSKNEWDVAIDSLGENPYDNFRSVWIGLVKEEDWTWVDGSELDFFNWGGGEPRNYDKAKLTGINRGKTPGRWYAENASFNTDGYFLEFGYPTDPTKADTDGDGVEDKDEIDNGTNPVIPDEFNLDIPVIESVSLSSDKLSDGGAVKVTVRVRSISPVKFLEKTLRGPSGNVYSGGGEALFLQAEPGVWIHEWYEEFSQYITSGTYSFDKIRAKNLNEEWSGYSSAYSISLQNSIIPTKPVIESVEVNPTSIVTGGEVNVSIKVRSNVPIKLLQKDLEGPSRTLYEDARFVEFTKVDGSADLWSYEWKDEITMFMPSGIYKYKKIRVQNVGELNSDYWPDLAFTVDGSTLPEIEGDFIGKYSKWKITKEGEGYGLFKSDELPPFTFKVAGDYVPSQTFIQENDPFQYDRFTSLYGEASTAHNLRVQTFGTSENAMNISTSTIQINFTDVVSAHSIGFLITDLDFDDVIIRASYKGRFISKANISRWIVDLFNSKPEFPTSAPYWDSENNAIVANTDSDGLLSDERLSAGSESANGWFVPNVAIDTLYFDQRNRAVNPTLASSIHIYLFSNVNPPSLKIEDKNDKIKMSFSVSGDYLYSIQESDNLIKWNEIEGSITALDSDFLFAENHSKKALVPTMDIGNSWINLDYDDSAWMDVKSLSEDGFTIGGGIGYARSGERVDPFDGYIALDLEEQMYRINASAYLRIPFKIDDVNSLESLVLSARVDDGFVAWLNGELVETFKAPDSIEWNSMATASNSDSIALGMVQYSLNEHLDKLKVGQNILAIQALNGSASNADFLFSCQLGGVKSERVIVREIPKEKGKKFYRVKIE